MANFSLLSEIFLLLCLILAYIGVVFILRMEIESVNKKRPSLLVGVITVFIATLLLMVEPEELFHDWILVSYGLVLVWKISIVALLVLGLAAFFRKLWQANNAKKSSRAF